MKPRKLRSLTLLAGLLVIAVIVLGLIPLNSGSKAALDRKANGRFSKVRIPTAENLDVRNRFSKDSQSQALEIQKREKKERRLRGAVPESMLKAKERLAREIPGLEVAFSDEIGAPEIVSIGAGRKMLTGKSSQSKEAVVRGFLTRNRDLYGLSMRQVGQLKKIADYTNPTGNIAWVEFRQEIGGLPVFQGELRAALNSHGELFRTVGRLKAEGRKQEAGAENIFHSSFGIFHFPIKSLLTRGNDK